MEPAAKAQSEFRALIRRITAYVVQYPVHPFFAVARDLMLGHRGNEDVDFIV
jgi:hypothetical protein